MTTTIKPLYGTPTPITWTYLPGLATTTTSGTGTFSSYVDNRTNLFQRVRIVFNFCTATGTPTANTAAVYLFFQEITEDQNGNFQGVQQANVPANPTTSGDGTVTGNFEPLLYRIASIPVSTARQPIVVEVVVDKVPPLWRLFCRNSSGLNFVGTAGTSPPATWVQNTNYSVENTITPATTNGYYYLATTDAGSSGASEPSWGTTIMGTTSDGGITWTNVGKMIPCSAYYVGENDQGV